MLEKLLSVLPYNPSLVHQLSFYGRRMRQEASVRRTGVLFLLLAFLVQFFAFVSPPQATLAGSTNDLINGGISSAQDASNKCANDLQNYKTILSYYGISCDDLARTTTVSLISTSSNKQLFSMGRLTYGATNKQTKKPTSETPVAIPGVAHTLYFRYLWSFDTGPSSTYTALKGTSSVGQKTFYVLFNCANLVFVGVPPHAPTPVAPAVAPNFTVVKGVKAKSQSAYYKNITAKPGDVVDYSIELTNTGNTTLTDVIMKDTIPKGFVSVPGSLANDGKSVTALVADYNTGSLIPGQFKRITFSATVPTPSSPCTVYTNSVTIAPTKVAPKQSTADVEVCQSAVTPPPAPTPQPIVTPVVTPVAPSKPAPVQTVAAPVPTPCAYNLGIPASSPECKPCDKSVSTADSLACLVRHKAAANLTQNLGDANNTVAHAGDSIVYTLYAENKGKAMINNFVFEENLSDVLDYANVTNLYGGNKDDANVITWPAVDIAPGQTTTVKVAVSVKSPIPQTPQVAGTGHFDHVMTNVYVNAINISVPTTPVAQIQTTAAALPNTGPGENLAVAAAIFVLAGYFFARSRLLASEAFIAVHENNSGGF